MPNNQKYKLNNSVKYSFSNCIKLEKVTGLETSNGVNFISMFNDCRKLKTIPLLNLDNAKKPYLTNYMIDGCYSLDPKIHTYFNTKIPRF